jgi:hypothetical protein
LLRAAQLWCGGRHFIGIYEDLHPKGFSSKLHNGALLGPTFDFGLP